MICVLHVWCELVTPSGACNFRRTRRADCNCSCNYNYPIDYNDATLHYNYNYNYTTLHL